MASVILSKAHLPFADIPNVITTDKPVIFWDTCPLLYFNTMVDRRAYNEYTPDANLLHLIESSQVYSFTSAIVYQEFTEHHDTLFAKDKDRENSMKKIMKDYGDIQGTPKKEELLKGLQALDLSLHLDDMVRRIWANTYVINEDPSFMQKAHNRLIKKEAPSREKQQYKDCYIWETFITLCEQNPHKGKSWFMTENSEDFCGAKKSKILLPELQDELDRCKGSFAICKNAVYVDIAKELGLIPK